MTTIGHRPGPLRDQLDRIDKGAGPYRFFK